MIVCIMPLGAGENASFSCLSCLFYDTPQVEGEAPPDLHAIWLSRRHPLTARMNHGLLSSEDGSLSSSSCVEPEEQMDDGALAISAAPRIQAVQAECRQTHRHRYRRSLVQINSALWHSTVVLRSGRSSLFQFSKKRKLSAHHPRGPSHR